MRPASIKQLIGRWTMSNYEYEDDDDDFTQDSSSNDLVKQLRKAAKQKDKELQDPTSISEMNTFSLEMWRQTSKQPYMR